MPAIKKFISQLHLRRDQRDETPRGNNGLPNDRGIEAKVEKSKDWSNAGDDYNDGLIGSSSQTIGRPNFSRQTFPLRPTEVDPYQEAGWAQKGWAGVAISPGASPNLATIGQRKQESNPYRNGKIPAIRDIDWSQVADNELPDFVQAYNDDASRFDSAVALLHGKGKCRATCAEIDLNHHRANFSDAFLMHRAVLMQKQQQHADDMLALRAMHSIEDIAQAQERDDAMTARDMLEQLQSEQEENGLATEQASLRTCVALALQEKYIREAEAKAQEEDEKIARELEEKLLREKEEEEAKAQEEDEKIARELEEKLLREKEEEDRLAAERARLRECVVCGDSKDPLDFPAEAPTSACDHPSMTCKECLESWMDSEFDTKGCDGIKCPECPMTLEYNDVQRVASAETFEKYDRISTRNALSSLPEFSWCLAAGCSFGQINDENGNFMECKGCGYKQCLKHKIGWHKDETCEQYDYRTSGQQARDEEAKTDAMIDTVSKKCPGPNCGLRIEKGEGCDHMTCRNCKFQFCWQCLASHKEIRKVGNTAHESWCKFHSKNLGIAWPFNMH